MGLQQKSSPRAPQCDFPTNVLHSLPLRSKPHDQTTITISTILIEKHRVTSVNFEDLHKQAIAVALQRPTM
jgi:O-acetylhomoserine/O-acetylserine sulfhydrylase-like pyridoxal-dependent enzyme